MRWSPRVQRCTRQRPPKSNIAQSRPVPFNGPLTGTFLFSLSGGAARPPSHPLGRQGACTPLLCRQAGLLIGWGGVGVEGAALALQDSLGPHTLIPEISGIRVTQS